MTLTESMLGCGPTSQEGLPIWPTVHLGLILGHDTEGSQILSQTGPCPGEELVTRRGRASRLKIVFTGEVDVYPTALRYFGKQSGERVGISHIPPV